MRADRAGSVRLKNKWKTRNYGVAEQATTAAYCFLRHQVGYTSLLLPVFSVLKLRGLSLHDWQILTSTEDRSKKKKGLPHGHPRTSSKTYRRMKKTNICNEPGHVNNQNLGKCLKYSHASQSPCSNRYDSHCIYFILFSHMVCLSHLMRLGCLDSRVTRALLAAVASKILSSSCSFMRPRTPSAFLPPFPALWLAAKLVLIHVQGMHSTRRQCSIFWKWSMTRDDIENLHGN